jgi:hypothetical protein
MTMQSYLGRQRSAGGASTAIAGPLDLFGTWWIAAVIQLAALDTLSAMFTSTCGPLCEARILAAMT